MPYRFIDEDDVGKKTSKNNQKNTNASDIQSISNNKRFTSDISNINEVQNFNTHNIDRLNNAVASRNEYINENANSRNNENDFNYARDHEAALAIKELLAFIGENPEREGLIATPYRVLESFREIFSGYHQSVQKLFEAQFHAKPINNDLIIIKSIKYFSTCEHHMLPVVGTVDIGYIPDKSILGLSKFARLVDIFARRLQVQERMTVQIAETIMKYLNPLGVAVHLSADHYCMIMRGIKSPTSKTSSFHFLGTLSDENQKDRFIRLVC